jgi:repressor LexA
MMSLTPMQHRCLDAIRRCQRLAGLSPTYEELAGALGLRSKSGVHRIVMALEERGAIRRIPRRRRAIEVLGAGAGIGRVVHDLPSYSADELREVLARAVGLLVEREGVAETATLLHRLGDRLPRRIAA